MATIDICGNDVEFICTAYTTTVYEHEFKDDPYPKVTGDIVADVMGVYKVSSKDFATMDDEGNIIVSIDYTRDNWQAEKRALWAMIRTAIEIRRVKGERIDQIPSYSDWDKSLVEWEPDLREMSLLVGTELQRGLFRTRAAVPEETSEEVQEG